MKKKVTLKDIAQKAGVSTSLVSFVMNGKAKQYRINDKVAERVKKIAGELDYQPNAFAKSLRDGRSNTIGVIVSDISNPFFADIVKIIELAAEEAGYMAIFASTDEDAGRTRDLVFKMLAKEVDGIILVPCAGSEQTVRSLIDRNIPLVLLDRYIPDLRTDFVCLDNEDAAYTITRHVISNGYGKVGLMIYDLNLSNMSERLQGYMKAMNDSGLGEAAKVSFVKYDDMENSCDRSMDELLSAGCEAIIFATNAITVHGLKYLISRGIRIPDKMAVACFDGGKPFEFFHTPLTHIIQPLEIMTRKAVDILIERLEKGNSFTQQIKARGHLVDLASSQKRIQVQPAQ